MMETDRLAVERVSGRSTVTRCFSKYPLKFIVPTKVLQKLILSGSTTSLTVATLFIWRLKAILGYHQIILPS
ncbi:hypothetical protein Hanom_Chr07g00629521 [Helianthus anomalus]